MQFFRKPVGSLKICVPSTGNFDSFIRYIISVIFRLLWQYVHFQKGRK